MEGVGYSLTDCANILKKEGVSIEQVRICGGGGKSQIWRQIIADLLKTDIYTLQFEEGPAFGVAILAGVALNIYPNVVEACNMLIKDKDVTKVNVINSDSYEKFHHMYNQVYNHLENDFSELAQL